MDAPATIGAAVDSIFAERSAMTAIGIAEHWFIFRPYTRPWHPSTAVAYQTGKQNAIFAKVPNYKTLYPRWQAHVNKDTVFGIKALLTAKLQGLFGF